MGQRLEGRPRSVLIAEDDPGILEICGGTFKRAGFKTIVCSDGEAALEKIRSRQPDVVLLDIRMPKVDGLTLVRRLRAEGNQIPVVLMSAELQGKEVLDFLESPEGQGIKTVAKPFDKPRTLVDVVRMVYEEAQQGLHHRLS